MSYKHDFTLDEIFEEPECRYCRGRGYLTVEPNSSLSYPCPDCTEEEE